MRPGRPSYTAEAVAALRARERLRPPALRAFDDPYARAFLTRATRWRIWPGVRDVLERLLDRRLPGLLPMAIARARWMDDLLLRLAPELGQVVFLGAGYDTTFVRHPELAKRLPYFEVDHPDTSAAKRARIARRPDLFGASFDRVRAVPVDFDREDLAGRLAASGYDPGRITAFVWSGVIPYLDRPAVEATLRVIGAAAPGSHLIADLGAAGSMRDPRSGATLRYFRRLGESLRFLIDPEEVKDLIEPHGLEVVEILRGAELTARTFAPGDSREVSEYAYMLHARVAPR